MNLLQELLIFPSKYLGFAWKYWLYKLCFLILTPCAKKTFEDFGILHSARALRANIFSIATGLLLTLATPQL